MLKYDAIRIKFFKLAYELILKFVSIETQKLSLRLWG
jgi:hypothetical protein